MNERSLGVALILISTVPFALSGVFTRFAAADVWVVLGWRGVFGGALTLLYVIWRRGPVGQGGFGWRGWVLATVGSIASICFLAAFRLTYVANVALIYTVTPFAAAALGWVLLREPVQRRVLVAAAICMLGVAVIVAGGLGAPRLVGDAVALGMVGFSALYLVLIRLFAQTDAVLAGVLSGAQLFAFSFLVSDPLAISAPALAWVAVFGCSFAAAFIMWTEGARRVPAAEAGLLGGAETPVAVILAWLLLAEVPPATTLLGGAIVMGAVLWQALADLRRA